MKKIRKIKNKRLVSVSMGFMVVVFSLFSMISCASGTNRVEVRIEVKNPNAIDFETYDKVLYQDLTLEWEPKDFTPEDQLKSFFLSELPRVIDRDIEPWDGKTSAADMVIPANSLLITGKLTLEIKERSKIKEIKDQETGKPKNVFTSIQHWDMTLALVMKESKTGKEIFKQDFKEKLSNVDTSDTTTKFNFEKIFFKLTNRFLMKVKKTKKMQRRYLLF
ncbi:MAG: hypothetical protein JSV88_34005 [Candidatus Aminicenantes bacterium]|nr:MAG: hypothetical protein JSV88_34005 [Candidatus Aminicenantes bacterium]